MEQRSDALSLRWDSENSDDPLLAIIHERRRTELKVRVRRLLDDLASNDLPMALLDLSQLHRLVADTRPDRMSEALAALTPAVFDLEGHQEDKGEENDELDPSVPWDGVVQWVP